MALHLPIHPSLRHPLTGAPLQALYVDKRGRARYPLMGASEPAPEATPPGDSAPAGDTYPANTPVSDMKPEEQAAYWRTQSRKHEDRVKAFGGLTTEQLADLKAKAERQEALEEELSSEKDKAVREATKTTRAQTAAEYTPRLVRAEFRAELKGRVPAEELTARLATITEPLDLSKFLTDSGEVDTAKVSAFVEGIAPVKGNRPAGPTLPGLGTHTAPAGAAGDQGRAMAARRFGAKS